MRLLAFRKCLYEIIDKKDTQFYVTNNNDIPTV